jgi:hypothetical protein
MSPDSTSAERPHQRTSQPLRQPRPRVLLVTHRDGFVELYSDHALNVVHQPMPWAGPGAEIEAERFVELTLPRAWRPLLVPGCRRWTGLFRAGDHTLNACRQRIVDQRLLDAIQAFGASLRGEGRV